MLNHRMFVLVPIDPEENVGVLSPRAACQMSLPLKCSLYPAACGGEFWQTTGVIVFDDTPRAAATMPSKNRNLFKIRSPYVIGGFHPQHPTKHIRFSCHPFH